MNKTINWKGWILRGLAMGWLCVWPSGARAETSLDDQKTIEELKKSYPLVTCPVSGEKLDGAMGAAIDYLYKSKVDGKDSVRLVRFCCASCPKKFIQSPDKYVQIIEDAAKHKPMTNQTPAPTASNGMCGMCGMSHP